MEKDGEKTTMVLRPKSMEEEDLDEAQNAAIEFMAMDVDEAREAIEQWHRNLAGEDAEDGDKDGASADVAAEDEEETKGSEDVEGE